MNLGPEPALRPRRNTALARVAGFACALLTLPATAAGTGPAKEQELLTLEAITGNQSLAGPTLKSPQLSPDGRFVAYLKGRPDDGDRLDLWVYDVEQSGHRRLVDADTLTGGQETLSSEERARRERQRTARLSGIVDYAFGDDGRTLLFPLGGELYLYRLPASGDGAGETRQLTRGAGGVTDPQLAPDGQHVAFIRDRELWVVDTVGGEERRLTFDASETIANGIAEFVADEEMDRHTGYWWSPSGSHLAFVRIDESAVPWRDRVAIGADGARIERQRYPAAGEPNVDLKLGIIELASLDPTKAGNPAPVRWIELGAERDIYLARVDWLDDGQLGFQRQARNQQSLELVRVDLATDVQTTLLTESSESWIDLHSDFRWLPEARAFIWTSARSGFPHLYRYDLAAPKPVALTSGSWGVDELLAVSPAGEVFFAGSRDGPRERHIYRVPLAGGPVAKLSNTHGWHDAQFDKAGRRYVDHWSNTSTPPQLELFDHDGQRLATLIANDPADASHAYHRYRAAHLEPEFLTVKAANQQTELQASILKAPGTAQGAPAIVYVYGGPAAQTVVDRWPYRADVLFNQYLAQHGFVVLSIDNRGTPRRGVRFGSALYRRQGDVEVADQVASLAQLVDRASVDPARVGVYGWSNGGYMSLMLLGKTDSYRCGVAGAPVVDWALYDTHYTERFMQRPADNPTGYADSSVLAVVEGLTEPLLLIHGMADDNVLFSNTTRLMSALQARGQPFRLMAYPGATHSFTGTDLLHRYRTTEDFFADCLKAR